MANRSISLKKGDTVSLEKADGNIATQICVGLSWGAIVKKGGIFRKEKVTAVDLDASVGVFSGTALKETVYYGKLISANGSIVHSGDDLTGSDTISPSVTDNEVIKINLNNIPETHDRLAFILNSYKKQDFADIPHAHIRVYEGTPNNVDKMLAVYDIANNDKFAGSVSMICGEICRNQNGWKFKAIGEPSKTRILAETLNEYAKTYIK